MDQSGGQKWLSDIIFVHLGDISLNNILINYLIINKSLFRREEKLSNLLLKFILNTKAGYAFE